MQKLPFNWGSDKNGWFNLVSPWKVVIFFGKKHVNWSSFGGVMIGRSWKIQFKKLKIGGIKTIIDLIVQLFPIISPLILDQFTCSLPKNVTTFHGEQDGIIHFCLSPNKRGVLALWIYIFTKKIMTFPNMIVQLIPIIIPLIVVLFTCYLQKI